MKYIIALSVLFLSCATTQNSVCPPPAPPIVKLDTIYMPIKVPVYDTVVRDSAVYTVQPLYIDTLHRTVNVGISLTGDNWPALQAATDFGNLDHRYTTVLTDVGDYPTSRTVLSAVENSAGTDYGQAVLHLRALVPARNGVAASTIVPVGGKFPAIAVQQCKGCDITNVGFRGQYLLPNTMSIISQDTLSDVQWQVGDCTFGRTNPEAAIVVDPFDDPAWHKDSALYPFYPTLRSHYLPGMNNAGSTAMTISGCEITNFVVGIMLTPSMQANGEDIYVDDNCIQYCKSAYAYSQAQSKNNTLTKLQDWGFTRTVLDGVNYGFPRLDGATPPKCQDWNIAGSVYQLVEAYTMAYTLTMRDITAEEVFKIGMVYGTMGTLFEGWTVDFQQAGAAIPSPDWYILGNNITWQNCELRHFNGNTPPMRLTFDNPGDVFRDCTFGNEPITKIVGAAVNNVKLDHNYLYYKLGALMADSGAADSWAQLSVTDTLHMNRGDFTGWLLEGKTLKIGDNLATNIDLPMGLVTAISGDTAFVSHIGVGAYDKHVYNLFYNRLKQ